MNSVSVLVGLSLDNFCIRADLNLDSLDILACPSDE